MVATARAHVDVTEEDVRKQVSDLLAAVPDGVRSGAKWLGEAYDRGLAWVDFPVGLGGLGAHHSLQDVVDAELAAAGASLREATRNVVGFGMAAPVLVQYASRERAQQWLRPLYCLDEWWCQLFSEPGAGSDLASLATRAERDGDNWRLTGQKVWTTLGHLARWAVVAARTDPELARHKGLTFFVLDMHQQGVEVRPLRQMTGDAEFNEVFLDDAVVLDEHRLGEVNAGWDVMMALLSNERTTVVEVGSTPPDRILEAIELLRALPAGAHRRVLRDRVARLWIEDRVTTLTHERAEAGRSAGLPPGPEGSTAKLARTTLNQRILDLCIDLMAGDGLLYPDTGYRPAGRDADQEVMDDLRWQFLRSRAATIEGGTSEVMRNILGERILGLPKEPS